MKLIRVLLIAFAAVVLLLVIAAFVAFNSGFQTWAARRALAAQPDLTAEIGKVDVGLSRATLENIRIAQPGMVLTLPSAVAELPVLKAATKTIQLRNVVAHGWIVDLTAPRAATVAAKTKNTAMAGYLAVLTSAHAAPAEKSAAFEGVFRLLELPVALSLDQADLSGEIIFPVEEGQPPGRAKVSIKGGDLGVGKEGRFAVNADAAMTGAVTSLVARTDIRARMDTASTFDRINAVTDAVASGAQFPGGARLRSDLVAERREGGAESYTYVAESGGKRLVDVKAALPAGGSRLEGTAVVSVRDSDLTAFALGRRLPVFAVEANTRFAANTQFTELGANGTLTATISQLDAVQEELKTLGTIRVNSEFNVAQLGDVIRVSGLRAVVAGAQPILTVDARQAFEFNGTTSALSVTDPAKELLSVVIDGIPLAWAQPFLKTMTLRGGDVRGAFVARAANGGFSLISQAPVSIQGLSLDQEGKPLLRNLDLSLSVAADVAPAGWQAQINELGLRSGGQVLFTFNAKAGKAGAASEPIKATGSYQANIPALAGQPALEAFRAMTGGTVQGDFTASAGERTAFAAKVVVDRLAAPEQAALPRVTLDIRGDLETDGKFVLEAPLIVERENRRSDLVFAATGRQTPPPANSQGPATVAVDARITSDVLHLPDLQILLAPLSATEKDDAEAPVDKTPDELPAWAGIRGQLTLALKRVVYSPELTVTDIGGTVRIAPDALTIEALRALVGTGGEVNGSGTVTFLGRAAERYAMNLNVGVGGLETGPALKALMGGDSLPLLEGKFDLSTKVNAAGPNLGTLAERAAADVKLTSKGGVFRPIPSSYVDLFSRTKAQLAKQTENVGTLGSIASAVGVRVPGALGGATARAQGWIEKLTDLESIVRVFSEVRFDQFTLDAAADTNKNTMLRDLTLIAPEVRFTGTGGLRYEPDLPLWKQDLTLKLEGAARGQAAELMKRGNLLAENTDTLGYTPLSMNFDIGGTAEKPDTSKLLTDLLNKVLTLNLQPAEVERLRQGDVGTMISVLQRLR